MFFNIIYVFYYSNVRPAIVSFLFMVVSYKQKLMRHTMIIWLFRLFRKSIKSLPAIFGYVFTFVDVSNITYFSVLWRRYWKYESLDKKTFL